MNDKKDGKPPLPSANKVKLLEGFEGVFDLLEEEMEEEAKRGGNKIADNRHDDNYELYNFLETEIVRLTKAHALLTQKLETLTQHSQTEALCEQQMLKSKRMKIELIKKLARPESIALTEMSYVWDGAMGPASSPLE